MDKIECMASDILCAQLREAHELLHQCGQFANRVYNYPDKDHSDEAETIITDILDYFR